MWVCHTFQLICLIISTWVMCWSTPTPVTFKIVIMITTLKSFFSTTWLNPVRHYTRTLSKELFDQLATYSPVPLLHQATRTFLTCDPVVDVALDQEFLTNAAPQRKVHGLIMGLAEWNCCGYSNVSVACCPGWARSDSVRCLLEIRIICKSVTPN